MATNYFYFPGKVKWAKVYPGSEDKEYNCYTMNFYPESVEDFQKSGCQLEAKTDEDGTFFRVRRDVSKQFGSELVNFGPPKVVDKDSNPFDKLIGNGSGVTVKIALFDTKRGKGHRLEAVQVTDWVEYQRPEEANSFETPSQPKLPF